MLMEHQQDLSPQILDEPPIHPQEINPAVPKELAYVALKCLQKEKKERFQTAGELATYLDWYIEGKLETEEIKPSKSNRLIKREPLAAESKSIWEIAYSWNYSWFK